METSDPGPLPSWASHYPHRCVTVRCSQCHHDLEEINQDGLPHFDSVEHARRAHLDYYGWNEVGDELLCPACTARRACEARGGHDLERTLGLYRRCTRDGCDYVERIGDAEIDAELHALIDREASRG